MSCENLLIPKPLLANCVTNLFGIPYGTAGRFVGGVQFDISGIVLHCEAATSSELCNEMKCRTKSSVISGGSHHSYHYGIGATGGLSQYVADSDISWTWGDYKAGSYATPPPPNISFNWPTLQALYGINVSPDHYVIDIALAIGHIVEASLQGCYECPTSSGLPQTQHEMLVQLLAYLAQEYDIPIDSEHINFHDNIRCDEGEECACTDIATLLAEVAAFCPPCVGDEAPNAPEAQVDDTINYIMGITEACCPSSPGCYVKVPWNACFLGDVAVDGTLDSYILGLAQDPGTNQWCLTRGCLATVDPIIGCGTVDDPLRLDLCAWGSYIPDEVATNMINLVGLDAAGCLIESPAADVVALYETHITPVDTPTIDLTVSGVSDHTLQADVKISAEANNQVEVRPDGLFVDFTCIDFVDAYPEEPVVRILGQNALNECVHQTSQSLVEDAICAVPEDMGADPTWLLGKTGAECPVFIEPKDVVAAGLTVSDGFCVHMNYDTVTGNINSELIVSQLPDNILQCLPGVPPDSGAYVPDLTVVSTNCIDTTYVGRQLTVDVILDPVADNIIECNANGLYVPLGGGITASDTDCIDLTLVGGVLSGVITLAPTQGLIPNAAQCIAGQGFYVPQGAGLTVVDTNCIDLNLVNGVLSATLVVNPSGDNQFVCGIGGAYVPIGAGLIANDTDCVNHSLVGGVLSTTLNIAGPQGGVPNILSCIAGQGLYVPESHIGVVDSTCIDLTFTGGILRADIIIDPTGDNQVTCLPAGLYVPPAAGLIALDTDCIALNLAGGDTLTATPILAPTQGGVPNILTCVAGQGLYVPEAAGLVALDTNCIELTLTGNDLSAVPVISPDDCNGLECRANGLYVNNDINTVSDRAPFVRQCQNLVLNNVVRGPVPGVAPLVVSITNPSDCNDMAINALVSGVGFTLTNTGGDPSPTVEAGYRVDFNGFVVEGTNTYGINGTPLGVLTQIAPRDLRGIEDVNIPPGATYTVTVTPIIGTIGNFDGEVCVDSYGVNVIGQNTLN